MKSKKIPSHEELASQVLESPLLQLKGMLRKPTNSVTIEQMNQAIEQGGAKGTQQLDTKKAIE